MAEAASAADTPRVSRLDRRKARTRQALIDAAVRLIAEGRGDRASIQEITEEADIGFGSFYNHFDSKEQLFQTASEEVLERWGQLIDRASAGITDPAELFAVGTRISGRLGWTHPDIAGFLTGVRPGRPGHPHAAWHRAPCATSRPGRPRAASPFPIPRSRSAPRPAACSGCCGCASGTRNASRRPPSTSSPRPSCACSASPPTKPPASPPSRSLPLRPGDKPRRCHLPLSIFPGTTMNQPARQLSRYGWRPADPPRRPVLFVNPAPAQARRLLEAGERT